MAQKILIIDDDQDTRETLQLRLEASGFDTVTAGDGEEGLKAFEAQKPNLILLDISMPKMDGYTFIKTFKAKYSITETPIIMLTGKDAMRDTFEMEGVSGFLTKPCEPSLLVQTINDCLK